MLSFSILHQYQGTVSEDNHLYSIFGILSLVGLVVWLLICNVMYSLYSQRVSQSDLRFPQALVISFSLGVGAIPWIIMSEVCNLNTVLIIIETVLFMVREVF
jgi:SP family sugar porter-like MFS transporter